MCSRRVGHFPFFTAFVNVYKWDADQSFVFRTIHNSFSSGPNSLVDSGASWYIIWAAGSQHPLFPWFVLKNIWYIHV